MPLCRTPTSAPRLAPAADSKNPSSDDAAPANVEVVVRVRPMLPPETASQEPWRIGSRPTLPPRAGAIWRWSVQVRHFGASGHDGAKLDAALGVGRDPVARADGLAYDRNSFVAENIRSSASIRSRAVSHLAAWTSAISASTSSSSSPSITRSSL